MGKEMKLQKGIVAEIKKQKQFEKEQQDLHRKYDQIGQETVIIEKNNMVKFFVRTCIGIVKAMCAILLLLLAAIGLMTLVYPEIRSEFLFTVQKIFNEIQLMI